MGVDDRSGGEKTDWKKRWAQHFCREHAGGSVFTATLGPSLQAFDLNLSMHVACLTAASEYVCVPLSALPGKM